MFSSFPGFNFAAVDEVRESDDIGALALSAGLQGLK